VPCVCRRLGWCCATTDSVTVHDDPAVSRGAEGLLAGISLTCMFVLELTYTAPLERVEGLMADHVAWLRGHYDSGTFLASGRKVPRDGGVILAVGHDASSVRELVKTDPFTVAGVCEYRVTEFVAANVAADLEKYRETLN
jgi:uncharacterized protein YciI